MRSSDPVEARRMTRIPSQTEYAAWRLDFKRRYKAAFTPPGIVQPERVDQASGVFIQDVVVLGNIQDAKRWVGEQEAAEAKYRSESGQFTTCAEAQAAGLQARQERDDLTTNPFIDSSDEWYSWFKGYGLYDVYLGVNV